MKVKNKIERNQIYKDSVQGQDIYLGDLYIYIYGQSVQASSQLIFSAQSVVPEEPSADQQLDVSWRMGWWPPAQQRRCPEVAQLWYSCGAPAQPYQEQLAGTCEEVCEL